MINNMRGNVARSCAVAILLATFACDKGGAQTQSPDSPSDGAAASDAGQDSNEAEPSQSRTSVPIQTAGFSFFISNRCPSSWRARVVPAKANRGLSKSTEVVIKKDETHELVMRVGDVLVFTSSDGGIAAMDFNKPEQAQSAAFEVVEDCTGVTRTYGRR